MADKWFYYVQEQKNAIARVNTDALEKGMGDLGFRPCSYREYLKARKEIREKERIENVMKIMGFEGKVPGEEDGDSN